MESRMNVVVQMVQETIMVVAVSFVEKRVDTSLHVFLHSDVQAVLDSINRSLQNTVERPLLIM
ncbi:hypothetical protein D3C80_1975220 [compost metagenome]